MVITLLALLLYAFSSVANEMHSGKKETKRNKTVFVLLCVDTFFRREKKKKYQIRRKAKAWISNMHRIWIRNNMNHSSILILEIETLCIFFHRGAEWTKSIQAIGFTWISPYLFWKENNYSWCCESNRDPIQHTLCSFEFISFCFFGCLQPLTLKTGSLCSFASFFFLLFTFHSCGRVASFILSRFLFRAKEIFLFRFEMTFETESQMERNKLFFLFPFFSLGSMKN